jgi:hypothetical protein
LNASFLHHLFRKLFFVTYLLATSSSVTQFSSITQKKPTPFFLLINDNEKTFQLSISCGISPPAVLPPGQCAGPGKRQMVLGSGGKINFGQSRLIPSGMGCPFVGHYLPYARTGTFSRRKCRNKY